MKPLLLHGPAIISSRNKLSILRKEFDPNNVVVFDSSFDLSQVLGSLMTSSLLPEERLFILENPPEDFTNYPLDPNPYTLILWFDHELSDKKPILEWARKNGEVLFFPEGKEASIFPFLDLLAQKNHRAHLELKSLQKTHEKFSDLQYVTTMIFYLLRNLTLTPKNVPAFVRQKLERQRKNFDLDKIKNLYKEILEVDFKLKSGLLEKDQAEFILVNKFL